MINYPVLGMMSLASTDILLQTYMTIHLQKYVLQVTVLTTAAVFLKTWTRRGSKKLSKRDWDLFSGFIWFVFMCFQLFQIRSGRVRDRGASERQLRPGVPRADTAHAVRVLPCRRSHLVPSSSLTGDSFPNTIIMHIAYVRHIVKVEHKTAPARRLVELQ